MKTEAEARQCWCPFARDWVVDTDGKAASTNRVHHVDGTNSHAPCLASECMAWRWRLRDDTTGKPQFSQDVPARGFCGLSGPP